jgi:hypothetical protein
MKFQIPTLFKSKRFYSAVIGLVIVIVGAKDPDLANRITGIQDEVVTIIVALILAFGAEDVVEAWRNSKG